MSPSPEQESAGAMRHLGLAKLRVRVRLITYYGDDIKAYEIVDQNGDRLPEFEPGSHVDLYLPDGAGVRQYSLCGDPQDRSRYTFAVQREVAGRGGSKAIFEQIHVDDELVISTPRNNFPLNNGARRHLLLAGGIGITPMMSMLHSLQRDNTDFRLHYCTRSPERSAFLDRLERLAADGLVSIHWDGGDPSKGLDVRALLKPYSEGTHLYYCGPPGFMAAVATASSHWPSGTTHSEVFTPPATHPTIAAANSADMELSNDGLGPAFQVKIASTGQLLDIPSDKTILQVFREHDIGVDANCELGVCGTCRTRYLEGEPDHRDFVLESHEHSSEMTICCSRSKSPLLVLDR